MLRNYLKIAYRNLTRNSVYSLINIGGLSVGIATSLMITLWIVDELNYNDFHKNRSRLYSIISNAHLEGTTETWWGTPYFVYDELGKWPTQFKNVSISSDHMSCLLSTSERGFNREGRYVSPEFLKMFRFELISGNRDHLLDDPYSVVLTEKLAKALFGDVDPLNKIVKLNNHYWLRVTGVLSDLPRNSSFRFTFLLPFSLFPKTTSWVNESIVYPDATEFETYGELREGADPDLVNSKIKTLIQKHTTWLTKELFLYPMDRWHLHNHFKDGKENTDDSDDRASRVKDFAIIAVGVLLIACINFMNLATARAERRAREVGIRKIVGSRRNQLVFQFLGESMLISSVSFAIALALTELLLPLYNLLVNRKLFIDYSSPVFWACGIALILFTGILAGSYPAFYLSSFNPARVLKGKARVGTQSILPRKVLVVTQFAFSIFLITGSIIVYQQMEFGRSRRLGYDKEFLITIRNNEGLKKTYPTIKKELLRTGAIVSATKTNSPITQVYESNFIKLPSGLNLNIANIYCEYDYVKTFGIKLLEGRDFSEQIASDTVGVILNQAAVDLLGFKNAVGHKATIAGEPREIIGVMENVLMLSPYEEIQPLYMVLERQWTRQWTPQNLTLRLKPTNDVAAAVKSVETIFKKINPEYPFDYSFVNDDFNEKFNQINLVRRLTNLFTVIAIFLACLGLFGLAAFTAETRTKEFGVRKVLGASWANLVSLMSSDFVRLVGISFAVTAPLTWWALNGYLERYPLRVTFNWWILPVAGLSVLVVALLIVGAQAIKVARTNPVESLRSE